MMKATGNLDHIGCSQQYTVLKHGVHFSTLLQQKAAKALGKPTCLPNVQRHIKTQFLPLSKHNKFPIQQATG
jgi:hypothetical protein